jgi:hypothetical protein
MGQPDTTVLRADNIHTAIDLMLRTEMFGITQDH